MQPIQLAINAILVLAVGVLSYFQFADKPAVSPTAKTTPSILHNAEDKGIKIVYFNIDTLSSQYTEYKQEQQSLEAKVKQQEAGLLSQKRGLEAEMMAFQKEVADYQQRAQYLTITDREVREKTLAQKEQGLMAKQQNYEQQVQQASAQTSSQGMAAEKKIYDKISGFLKEYAKEKNYHYIIGQSVGSGIWYADEQYNITADIVTRLNEKSATTAK